jgi:hypothetical protein
MIHTKESIQTLLDRSDAAVIRAMQAIYARQTENEKRAGRADERNGIGFNKFDAEILTDFLRQLKSGRTLSFKQVTVARKKMRRYWKQLVDIANGDEEIDRIKEMRANEELVVPEPAIIPSVSPDRVHYDSHCTCENLDGEAICDWCEERKWDAAIQAADEQDERRRMDHKFGRAGSW